MTNVTLEEAQVRLADLIKAAQSGDDVIISDDGRPAVKLVPVADQSVHRKAGSAKGKIVMSEDFDDPLEDFDEYMP